MLYFKEFQILGGHLMETENYDNEISLRELIEILLKGWKFIIIIPLLVGITTYGISKYVLDPTYESESTLQVHVSSNENRNISTDSIDDILKTQSFAPEYSIESYIQQIMSPEVLMPVIQKLEVEDTYTYEAFRNKLTITPIKNSSLITISVSDSNAESAALIVNTVSEVFIAHVSNKQVEQLDNSTKLLTTQLTIEKDKLDKALNETKIFDSKVQNINLVKQDLDLNLNQFNKAKVALTILNDTYEKSNYSITQDIAISKEKIIAYDKLLQQTDKVFQLTKDIYDASISAALVSTESLSVEEQHNYTVLSDELNPIYIQNLSTLNSEQIVLINSEQQLKKLTAMYHYNLEALTSNVTTLESTINSTRSELAELTYEKQLLDGNLSIAKNTYAAFNKKLESARVIKAAKISDASVLWMSKGYVASTPVGPKKALNTMISIVLAGMLTVFILFFKHYWQESADNK